jgi:hypothetical protein
VPALRVWLDQVSALADVSLQFSHYTDSGTNMANRKTTEVVTRNEEYTDGFVAGAAGQWVKENPHIPDSWEWMSWQQGWFIGRAYYMDEGWVIG